MNSSVRGLSRERRLRPTAEAYAVEFVMLFGLLRIGILEMSQRQGEFYNKSTSSENVSIPRSSTSSLSTSKIIWAGPSGV